MGSCLRLEPGKRNALVKQQTSQLERLTSGICARPREAKAAMTATESFIVTSRCDDERFEWILEIFVGNLSVSRDSISLLNVSSSSPYFLPRSLAWFWRSFDGTTSCHTDRQCVGTVGYRESIVRVTFMITSTRESPMLTYGWLQPPPTP